MASVPEARRIPGARCLGCQAAVAAMWLLFSVPAAAQLQTPPADEQTDAVPADQRFEETVEVVGATPIHGIGIDRDKVPSNVQSATAAGLARTPGVSLGEQLVDRFASVHANEAQTNPFQPDLQFRGFTGSPLLGLPQGLAIYQDGVRLNEPFGDTMNWDLIPDAAIASVNLMPGSNPLFGLNALGGAISVQTKSGFTHPGHGVTFSTGSFARRWADVHSGGNRGRFAYFVAGRVLAEDGWRDFSPSRVRQVFGNVEWRDGTSLLNASVTAGANRLIGNGAAPVQLLEESREAIFTRPDETKIDMGMFTLRGRHFLASNVIFDGVAFYRPATVRTFNGDDTAYDECEDEGFEGLICSDEGEGEPVVTQFGSFVAADDDNPFDGTNNTSRTRTRGWGGSGQVTIVRPVAGRQNHFVIGGSIDGGRSRYGSDTELARLTADRGTIGTGILDSDAAVRLRTRVKHSGVYLADFFTVAPGLTVMGAGRYTHSIVELRDQLGDDLTGDHRFSRLNPSAGATYELGDGATMFGSFSMASRVPAPSELSCADPEAPCRLPNAFVADPPLNEVVSRTSEGGLRGSGLVGWSASIFRTSNRDDIIFISSGALTNEGYFANVGDTLRRGLELSAAGRAGRHVRWGAAYTYLRATFETPLMLSSPNHPEEVDGEIEVSPGDSIPGIPRHNVKADVSVGIGRGTLGVNVVGMSSQFLRGDEANLLEPVEASAVVHVTGGYALNAYARIVGQVTNLFDNAGATFGLLGEADDVLGDDFDDPRFLSPRAPRAAWIGIELGF